MENKLKSFGIRRNIDFFKANFRMMIKSGIEYKFNFYSAIISMTFFSIIDFFTLYILYSATGDVISWKFYDYLIAYTLSLIITGFGGLFTWSKDLSQNLLSGEMNTYKLRPIKEIIGFYSSKLSSWALISIFQKVFFLLLLILYFDINFSNILFSLFIIFLLIIYNLSFFEFLESISFFLKETQFSYPFYYSNSLFNNYPAPFFKKNYSNLLIFILPNVFIGSLLIPMLMGYEIWKIEIQLSLLILLIIITIFGTYYMWKIGLKKYEAFG